jgi:hypothetical protein
VVDRRFVPEVQNTYRLVTFSQLSGLDGHPITTYVCRGSNGCGGLVVDKLSHQQFHDLAESEIVRAENRIKEMEREIEKLKTSARLPRRSR